MTESQLDWNNKVAVVTGGASGIGREIVKLAINKGMKVVLADINIENINEVVAELKVDKTRILAVQTDVTKYESVENLASKTFETFGQVDFLFNNAGVSNNNFVWESSIKDWEWILGVNLMGVVHGIKAFVPKMIERDSGFIVNTSSMSGLMSANLGIYSVSKHAVVSLSETLLQSLKLINSNLRVAVFCPEYLKTKINFSERNRPEELQDSDKDIINKPLHPKLVKFKKLIDNVIDNGMDPKIAVEMLFKEMEEGKFYIMTHKDEKSMQAIRNRMEGILEGVFKEQKI